MSDPLEGYPPDRFPLDSYFDQLRGQPPPAPFAPAEAVRRRGRQRTFHQSIVAGVAVLAVTGLGTGSVAVMVGSPDPPPPGASPASPSPASPGPSAPLFEVLDEWLLTADDLDGSGWQYDVGELLEGPWYWDGTGWCPEYRVEDYQSIEQRVALETSGWYRPGEGMPERVDQLVEVFEPGAAARNIEDVVMFLDLCSRSPAPDAAVAPTEYEVEDTGFVGEESLLIRVGEYYVNEDDQIEPVEEFHQVVVVRVGDAVTTIRYGASDGVYDVAEAAATRLQQ